MYNYQLFIAGALIQECAERGNDVITYQYDEESILYVKLYLDQLDSTEYPGLSSSSDEDEEPEVQPQTSKKTKSQYLNIKTFNTRSSAN